VDIIDVLTTADAPAVDSVAVAGGNRLVGYETG
jgi:hypothetical protein